MFSKNLLSIFIIYAVAASLTPISEAGSLEAGSGSYSASWTISGDELVMTIVAKTTGWVGFGISPSGNMAGADIFISGVNETGAVYGFDMFASRNGEPVLDAQQDVTSVQASESSGETTVSFRRPLISTDAVQDVPIPDTDIYFIWAWGDTDVLGHHALTSRGATLLNFST